MKFLTISAKLSFVFLLLVLAVRVFDPEFGIINSVAISNYRNKQKLVKKGEKLFTEKGCVGCHGDYGNSNSTYYPRLAGQDTEYLVQQLSDIKTGARKNGRLAEMFPYVQNLNRDEIEALSFYLTAQRGIKSLF